MRAAPYVALACLAAAPGLLATSGAVASSDARVAGVSIAEDTTAPLVAVCVTGSVVGDARGAETVIARGGRVEQQSPWTRCSLTPAGDVGAAMWLAGRWSDPRGASEPPSLRFRALGRLDALAMEGRPSAGRSLCLGVSGAVARADAERLARHYVRVAVPDGRPAPASQSSERLSVLEDPRAKAPQLYIGYPLLDATAKDLAALWVAAMVLAGSPSARLPRLLIHRRGRVDVAEASIVLSPASPLFVIVLSINEHSTIDRSERYVAGSLKQLRIVGPSEHELGRGRALARMHHLEQLDRSEGRAAALAEYECAFGKAIAADHVLDELSNVTATSVRDVSRRYLMPTQRSVVEVYPPGSPQDDPSLHGYTLHTVEHGETWESIARGVRHSVERLARENELDPRYALTPGQALWIPPPPQSD